MSWLSSIGDAIGGAVKSVGKGIAKAAGAVGGVVKKIATPALSFAAGLVPGVGPLLSKGVDMLGGALLGSGEDPTTPAGEVEQAPVLQFMGTNTGQAMGLGSSPAAMAMASATSQAQEEGQPGWFARATGIGDGKPGVFGIGDGKPGVFGIGTGKNKVRKQAEDEAREQGLSTKAVKLAGEEAVANMGKGTQMDPAWPSGNNPGLSIPLIGGILALFLL